MTDVAGWSYAEVVYLSADSWGRLKIAQKMHFPPLLFLCSIFQSRIFHPCIFDRVGAANFSLAYSSLAFSASPTVVHLANHLIATRPRVELTASSSLVQRFNRYATKPLTGNFSGLLLFTEQQLYPVASRQQLDRNNVRTK